MNNVKCGYLDNIVYDFENNTLPIDDIYNNVKLFDGLKWEEETKIVKYYSLARKYGANSVYHLKLAYTVAEIIKKYIKNAQYGNRYLSVTPKYW